MNNYQKYTNEILDDIQTYELVLQGKIKRFPAYFWERPWSYESAAQITRYLIERKLNWEIEDIPKKVSKKTFKENKLGGMLSIVYNESPTKCISLVYPNKFKPWEFARVQVGIWNDKETVAKAIRWLIEEQLKWSREDICNKYGAKVLRDNGFSSLMDNYKSLYEILDIAYPYQFKPWDLNCVGRGFWMDKDNVKHAIKWLIEEELKWNSEQIKANFSSDILYKYGIGAILFNRSLYSLIDIAYPNRFKPWELNYVKEGFWNDKNIEKALRWLIEEKLNWNDDDIKNKFSSNILLENGLISILSNKDLYGALNLVYPNRFKPWELKKVANNYWRDEKNVYSAIRYVMENKIKPKNKNELMKGLSNRILSKNGLGGLNSYKKEELLRIAYPEIYKEYIKNKRV